ncbi:hypothetical protein Desti_0438 [Desulfomonile tiedjei DSM 6799]|uniref:Uncharacterized protein n=1 Tax=Desulfomonile tiedjei (strain ATCC 49306 / DSM 6799 / DCB-1) TaxID=706587 RepID=I4C0T2_DESTA|nr:hypothetical protein Desti_0438 [Desulfomonile tiedjei DSM 6799]
MNSLDGANPHTFAAVPYGVFSGSEVLSQGVAGTSWKEDRGSTFSEKALPDFTSRNELV